MSASSCITITPLINFIKSLLTIAQWAVPVVIIALGTVDLFKAVIASKEDEIKNAQKMLIKRVIYGVVIFFIPLIIQVVFDMVSAQKVNGEVTFFSCWQEVTK